MEAATDVGAVKVRWMKCKAPVFSNLNDLLREICVNGGLITYWTLLHGYTDVLSENVRSGYITQIYIVVGKQRQRYAWWDISFCAVDLPS